MTTNEDLEGEVWAVIKFAPDYSASNLGRIKRTTPSSRYNTGRKSSILKPSKNEYPHVNLGVGGQRKNFTVHVCVANAFLGQRKDGYETNHIDGNKHNNKLSNLEYITRQENKNHAKLNGLTARGEKVHGSKLTTKDVYAMRELLGKRVNQTLIANKFSVSMSTIYSVQSRRTWKHLPELKGKSCE